MMDWRAIPPGEAEASADPARAEHEGSRLHRQPWRGILCSMEELREACAEVARRARFVRIKTDRIPGYAASLPVPHPAEPGATDPTPGTTREERAAYWLTLDAINFGSGWFPTLRKRPGQSGYHTISAGLNERFESAGPWSSDELQNMSAGEIAAVTGQDHNHELMGLFAASLRDLGGHITAEHSGSFAAVLDAAGGSAVTLARQLRTWDCFSDCSRYDELELPFLKRAQIAAADLQRAGVGRWRDLDRLTMFADNLVPHVLRLDGILRFDPELVARIDREELIEHGSAEEVEIRACALHAVELMAAARPTGSAAEIDQLLWRRGHAPAYKAARRHRSRCRAY
jgi:hypothetical protein